MTTRALRPKDRGFMKDTEDNESFWGEIKWKIELVIGKRWG
jgi:hypothetical protein